MTLYDEKGMPIACEVCDADLAEYEWFDYADNRVLQVCAACRRTIDQHNANEDAYHEE